MSKVSVTFHFNTHEEAIIAVNTIRNLGTPGGQTRKTPRNPTKLDHSNTQEALQDHPTKLRAKDPHERI